MRGDLIYSKTDFHSIECLTQTGYFKNVRQQNQPTVGGYQAVMSVSLWVLTSILQLYKYVMYASLERVMELRPSSWSSLVEIQGTTSAQVWKHLLLSWLQIGLMIGFLFSPAIDLPDFMLIYVLIIGSRTF